MNPYRILIVAHDPLARAGLAALLAGQDGCTVVGQVAGDDPALDVYRPDALIWDLGWDPDPAALPDLDGGPPVVALLPDPTQAADAWSAGARGLLLRSAPAAHLITAMAAVCQGLGGARSGAGRGATAGPSASAGCRSDPARNRGVAAAGQGLSNKAIARALSISEHTVKFHINAILGKLHAQSRTEAVVHAIRLGLVAV